MNDKEMAFNSVVTAGGFCYWQFYKDMTTMETCRNMKNMYRKLEIYTING